MNRHQLIKSVFFGTSFFLFNKTTPYIGSNRITIPKSGLYEVNAILFNPWDIYISDSKGNKQLLNKVETDFYIKDIDTFNKIDVKDFTFSGTFTMKHS